jgi:OOP family OmpA-OmpF porin
MRSTWKAISFAAALGFAGSAGAEELGFALQLVDPAPAGDTFFAVPDAAVDGRGTLRAGLLGSYAWQPLRLVDKATKEDIPNGGLVQNQVYMHLGVSLALWDRLLLEGDLPLASYQNGQKPFAALPAVGGTSFSDLRLGARLAFAGGPRDAVSFAFAADVFAPMGERSLYATDGQVRVHPRLVASGRIRDRFAWALDAGYLWRKNRDLGFAAVGHAATFGAAAALLLADGALQLGPELYGRAGLPFRSDLTGATVRSDAPLELMLGGKVRLGSLLLGLGGGAALTRGAGAGRARALATLAYAPQSPAPKPKSPDRDGDGIADDLDACPEVLGVASADPAKNGCPPDRDGDGILDDLDACPEVRGIASADPSKNGCPPDRDGDGIPDAADACPDSAGSASEDPSKNGCPPDRDGDGIPDDLDACPKVRGITNPDLKRNGCPPELDSDGDGIPDATDACPDSAGPASEDPRKNGCPQDRDGDGIPDDVDACPDSKGLPNSDPTRNGCPKRVVIKLKSIEILQQVQFETGKDVIRKESDGLLAEVAEVLTKHAELMKVSIEGHTDNVGTPVFNLDLSRRRAAAVKAWLVKRGGIDPNRLSTWGYGQTRPLLPNNTIGNRQKNRRVEFKILERGR